eukprot:TRINITY_DN2977_c0_g1_i1.p2 TRINITY_DN2977_c0_g1~~TRINITY_DN2977_c0_g1_i1.p2  ORF type:complete len:228 (+),score=27.68 TRINITY_DN2977_c0_g1_i1:153-836(+)
MMILQRSFGFKPCKLSTNKHVRKAYQSVSQSAQVVHSFGIRRKFCPQVAAVVEKSEGEICGGLGSFNVAEDVMTKGSLYVCHPDTPVEEALQLLVAKRVTGLPVVNQENKIVGIVSDFDLLALDALVGEETQTSTMFPPTEQDWQAFKDLKALVAKRAGQVVSDVMTEDPITIFPDMCVEEVTRLILTKKMRRLPVVDKDNKLVGIITRGNIIKAALQTRLEMEAMA